MSNLQEQINRFGQNEQRVDHFVNGPSTGVVTTSGGLQYPTLHNAVTQILNAGGFVPYETTEGLLASIPAEPYKCAVALDTLTMYIWDGTLWTAKAQNNISKTFFAQFTALRREVNQVLRRNQEEYILNVRGRFKRRRVGNGYVVTGYEQELGGYDAVTTSYANTGFIFVPAGATVTCKVRQWNPNDNSDVSWACQFDLNFRPVKDHTVGSGTEGEMITYTYTAPEDCYFVFTSESFGNPDVPNAAYHTAVVNTGEYRTATPSGLVYKDTLGETFTIRNLLHEMTTSKTLDADMSTPGVIKYPFDQQGRFFRVNGESSIWQDEDEYRNTYSTTGYILLGPGDVAKGKVMHWNPNNNGNVSDVCIFDLNGHMLEDLTVPSGPESEWQEYTYTADRLCYIQFTTINQRNAERFEVSVFTQRALSNVVDQSVNTKVEKQGRIANDYFVLPKPSGPIKIEMFVESLPSTKAEGSMLAKLILTSEGVSFTTYAKFAVQGSSSAVYPKKNWSYDFYTDDTLSTERQVKIGDFMPQEQLVWKANWIDATHSRNIMTNRLWEEMVQTRKGYPKREVDASYVNATGINTLNTGATGHVDGYPAAVYVNGDFYGIGTLNVGKKRSNYNLSKSNKAQVQFELLGGAHTDFTITEPPVQLLGLRNPSIPGYEEGGAITDTEVYNRIKRLWSYNAMSVANRRANVHQYYNLQNIVDWSLLLSFTAAADLINKNSILTTWDGNIWSVMPYDLDTTFGLHWAGTGVEYEADWWHDEPTQLFALFHNTFNPEIKARYKELRDSGVFTVDTVYRLEQDIESRFGSKLFKMENERWTNIPSKNVGGINQIMDWTRRRIIYLDSRYGYLEDGVTATHFWNPPTLAPGASTTEVVNVPGAVVGETYKVEFSMPLQGTTMTGTVTNAGKVNIIHSNPTSNTVNLNYNGTRLIKVS